MTNDNTTDTAAPPQGGGKALGKFTGKLPARGDPRLLNFSKFVTFDKVPKSYNPWKKRRPFMPRTFGNTREGCCTKSSQALAAMRFERMETRATPKITDDEIHRVYREGVRRHYNSDDDLGMYELDALSDFRKPETTFKDEAGHPITIDAYTAVNIRDKEEVKAAIALSGKFGIKICLSLPDAFLRIDPPAVWDVPRDADGKPLPLLNEWQPRWGHSLFTDSYDERGIRLIQSWYEGLGLPEGEWPLDEQVLTWDALAYSDESFWLIQSMDFWHAKPLPKSASVDLEGITKAVNRVSRTKITASRRHPYQRGK